MGTGRDARAAGATRRISRYISQPRQKPKAALRNAAASANADGDDAQDGGAGDEAEQPDERRSRARPPGRTAAGGRPRARPAARAAAGRSAGTARPYGDACGPGDGADGEHDGLSGEQHGPSDAAGEEQDRSEDDGGDGRGEPRTARVDVRWGRAPDEQPGSGRTRGSGRRRAARRSEAGVTRSGHSTEAGGHAAQVDRAPLGELTCRRMAPRVGTTRLEVTVGPNGETVVPWLGPPLTCENALTARPRRGRRRRRPCAAGRPPGARPAPVASSDEHGRAYAGRRGGGPGRGGDSASISTWATPSTCSATSPSTRRVARHGAQNAVENWTSVARSPSSAPRSVGESRSRPSS